MRIVLIIVFVCGPACAGAARLMVLGDSLSNAYNMPREDGWVARVAETLEPGHEIVNASISGETTAGALARLPGLLEARQPDVVLVELGGNDGLRGLPPAQVRANLDAVLAVVGEAGAEALLMQIRLPPNLGPVYIERFEGLYRELADSHGIRLLPFFLDDLYDRPGMLMADGIHPTAAAQAEMAAAMLPVLRQVLED